MKKFLFTILSVCSVMAFALFIVTADAKPKEDKSNNGKKPGVEATVGGGGTNLQQVTPQPNMKPDNPVKVLSHSGVIKGTIVCGEELIAGALVYIPGMSFMAKTDLDGKFVLSYVPNGVYDLYVEAFGEDPIIIPNVEVVKKTVTNIGDIEKCADSDGDGFDSSVDCDDTDPDVNPDATEICGDQKDNDCDDGIDDEDLDGCCTDADGDGFFAEEGCDIGDDCDDDDPNVNPDATEICDDDIDNDCDGLTDDEDSDATEICDDGIDNDCDGDIDEADSDCDAS